MPPLEKVVPRRVPFPPPQRNAQETYLSGASVQPSLELQLHALSMEQLEARLRCGDPPVLLEGG